FIQDGTGGWWSRQPRSARLLQALPGTPDIPPRASLLHISPPSTLKLCAGSAPQPNISCEAPLSSKVNNGLENHLIGIGREAEPYPKIRGNLSRQHHMHGRYDIMSLISHLVRIL